jgi:UDP-3-O-[3-hydroxymyristoyl] glucosamine N-acyltransferase
MPRRSTSRIEFEDEYGQVVVYHRHPNGGGLVSPRAQVDETASIARDAYVETGARVGPRSSIGAGSWVDVDAYLGKDVVVGRNVHIGPRASARDSSRIESGSRLGADVTVMSRVRVLPDTTVPAGTVVTRHDRNGYGIAA